LLALGAEHRSHRKLPRRDGSDATLGAMRSALTTWVGVQRAALVALRRADSTISDTRRRIRGRFARNDAADSVQRGELGFEERTAHVADRLVATTSALTRRLRRDRRILSLTLDQVWGDAFQMYDAVVYASYEQGAIWAKEAQQQARPLVWDTLLDLHARACRTASEIGALQRSGHPVGAVARHRSLHELAVVAFVLQGADEEITRRFRDYEAVEQYQDAQHYQRHVSTLGYGPLPEDEVETLRLRHDEVVARWGQEIKKPNGWAAPLASQNSGSISFAWLEQTAGLGHLHPFYRYGSHAVHGGPRSSSIQRAEINGVAHRMPGATVFSDLAETAHGALISVQQVNSALMIERLRASDLDERSVVAVGAVGQLVERAGSLYGAAADLARSRGWFFHSPDA